MSPDGKNHKQTDRISIDRRGHSAILHVLSFCVADCDTDQNPVVAVRKQATQTFDVKRLILRNLRELEVRKQDHIKI
jgi:hypothetical protein